MYTWRGALISYLRLPPFERKMKVCEDNGGVGQGGGTLAGRDCRGWCLLRSFRWLFDVEGFDLAVFEWRAGTRDQESLLRSVFFVCEDRVLCVSLKLYCSVLEVLMFVARITRIYVRLGSFALIFVFVLMMCFMYFVWINFYIGL